MAVDWPGRGNRGKASSYTEPIHQSSITALIREAAPLFEAYDLDLKYNPKMDEVNAHRVIDTSLTARHNLRRSLLVKGDPFKESDTKRETSKSKRIIGDTDIERTPSNRTRNPRKASVVRQFTPAEIAEANTRLTQK